MVWLLHKAGETIRAMKRLLTTLVILSIGMTAFAQFGSGRPGGRAGIGGGRQYGPSAGFRPGAGYFLQESTLELGVTINYFSKAEDGYRPAKLGFFGEYRVDVTPVVDLGIQLYTTFGKRPYFKEFDPIGPEIKFWQGSPLVVTDINLLPYSFFNPYVGLGIGPGFGYTKNDLSDKGEWTQALVIDPRAGIELFECLRMSVHYQWYLNHAARFSHLGLSISWAFTPGRGRGRRPLL